MDPTLSQKIQELSSKYEIPEAMLRGAIELEKDKVVLKNRRLAPKLLDMVERYALLYPGVTSQEEE
ncbi:hypothetical protein [Pseudanabaena sp. FACHB-2040]|uniref:hypothetical protein n=1 Tax=Pseudanabaena sp. FACHB-2040 TaxID=2692859 RepID=UPI00168901BF|nr:hypothetical protein [Pseudanabaena sp. FACHB-2040]MBD2261079.1 hypothetical protein [Pseudanabaena sp. FACHB-2040]